MDVRAPNLNNVTLSGNVVAEPELRHTQSGRAVFTVRIANSRRYLDGDEWKDGPTTFINVVVWGAQGERLSGRVHKGMPVVVEGRLQGREYTDKEGQKRQVYEIVAMRVQVLAKGAMSAEPTAGAGTPEEIPLPDFPEGAGTEEAEEGSPF